MRDEVVRGRLHIGLAAPIAFSALAVAGFVALGTWQLERKAQKEELIERLDRRLSAAPMLLPAHDIWSQLDSMQDEFRHVQFAAAFVPGAEALVYAGPSPFPSDMPGAGYWVFALARRTNGDLVVVNRGYVPQDYIKEQQIKEERKSGAPRGGGGGSHTVEIIGVMRWPQPRGYFAPADDVARNLWFVRDHRVIARAKDWGDAAPFYVELETPQPPGGLPRPPPVRPDLRNEHLQYAITWYGLSAAVGLMLVFWLRAQRQT
jgi:surfeit locus 1 family protein